MSVVSSWRGVFTDFTLIWACNKAMRQMQEAYEDIFRAIFPDLCCEAVKRHVMSSLWIQMSSWRAALMHILCVWPARQRKKMLCELRPTCFWRFGAMIRCALHRVFMRKTLCSLGRAQDVELYVIFSVCGWRKLHKLASTMCWQFFSFENTSKAKKTSWWAQWLSKRAHDEELWWVSSVEGTQKHQLSCPAWKRFLAPICAGPLHKQS